MRTLYTNIVNLLSKVLPSLPSLSKLGSSPDSFLCVDIGTDFVKVLRVENTPEGRKITGKGCQSLPWEAVRGSVLTNEEQIVESLQLAIEEAVGTERQPNNAVVSLGGELITNFTTTAKVHRVNSEEPISAKELADTKQKITDIAYMEGEKTLGLFSGTPDLEIELVNSLLTLVKVDNFLVEKPVGFKGEDIELSLYTSFAPKFHLETIKRVLSKLRLKVAGYQGSLYGLTKYLSHEPNAVIIDVGGNCTDIAVVFGGSIVGSRALGLGGRFFSEIISKNLGVPFNEAESKKLSFTAGNSDGEQSDLINSAFSDLLPLWLSGLSQALLDIEGIKILPSTVFLTGGGSLLPIVQEFLRDYPWAKSLPFKGPLEVKKVEFEGLNPTFVPLATTAKMYGN